MTIRHIGRKWILFSKKTDKELGSYNTKTEALKRERQIQYFKRIKK